MRSDSYNNEQCLRIQNSVFKSRRSRKFKLKHLTRKNVSSFVYQTRMTCLFPLLLKELLKNGYICDKFVRKSIIIPKHFSLKDDYDSCIDVFKQILSSYLLGVGKVVLDFSKCIHSEMSAFSLLNILVREIYYLKERYNKNLYRKTIREISCIPSKTDGKTNKYLHAFGYHQLDEIFMDGGEYLPLDILNGKGKHSYLDNPKAVACSEIANFIQKAGDPLGVRLTVAAKNKLEGFVSEVLNNAEDHSIANSEWYVNGIAFNEKQKDTDVIELHLAIVNIGPSMFEGFENTKTENLEMYSRLDRLYLEHSKQFGRSKNFQKESLFMLYMLNEGVSRLKYQDKSRGNGTMNFIDSFMDLGSFGDKNSDFSPMLNIISGHGILTCDYKYKPFKTGSVRKISLNKEKDIHKLPDVDYLKCYGNFFPGTILESKIYLNKEYIFDQIKKQNNE